MKRATSHFIDDHQSNHTTKINSMFTPILISIICPIFPPVSPFSTYLSSSLRREYLPITMDSLQLMIDTDRIDISQPIDLVQICNTGLFDLKPDARQYGFQLKDEGLARFKSKIHIEVQHASELVISTIERNGGIIWTAYYDMYSLQAMRDAERFFQSGKPIPRRLIPPQDAVEYYSDPKNRGYLADPEAVNRERLVSVVEFS